MGRVGQAEVGVAGAVRVRRTFLVLERAVASDGRRIAAAFDARLEARPRIEDAGPGPRAGADLIAAAGEPRSVCALPERRRGTLLGLLRSADERVGGAIVRALLRSVRLHCGAGSHDALLAGGAIARVETRKIRVPFAEPAVTPVAARHGLVRGLGARPAVRAVAVGCARDRRVAGASQAVGVARAYRVFGVSLVDALRLTAGNGRVRGEAGKLARKLRGPRRRARRHLGQRNGQAGARNSELERGSAVERHAAERLGNTVD